MNVTPSVLIYMPVNRSVISSVTIQITKDEFVRLDNLFEKICIFVKYRSKKTCIKNGYHTRDW